MNLAVKLRQDVEALEAELRARKQALSAAECNCRHDWGKVVYDPVVREAYTDPGDRPGTMGVDWRGPVHVPREETPRCTRKCKLCGKVEHTFHAETQTSQVPRF